MAKTVGGEGGRTLTGTIPEGYFGWGGVWKHTLWEGAKKEAVATLRNVSIKNFWVALVTKKERARQ